jgi:hypothetical protein
MITYIVIALSGINIFAYGYYRVSVMELKAVELYRVAVMFLTVSGIYMGTFLFTYFKYSSTTLIAPMITMTPASFELSSSNAIYHGNFVKKVVTLQSDMGLFVSFLLPVVLLGSFVFAIFGGAGLGLLPLRIVSYWLSKPEKPQPLQHVLGRKILIEENVKLLERIKELRKLKREIDFGVFTKKNTKATRVFEYDKGIFELKRVMLNHEEEFKAWYKQEMITKYNPMKSSGAILAGAACASMSIWFMIHVSMCLMGVYHVMEQFLVKLAQFSNTASLFFFVLLSFYILISMAYGSSKLAFIWSNFFDSHPVRLSATWTDTLLLVLILVLPGTIGYLAFMGRYVPEYFRHLAVHHLYVQILGNLPIMLAVVKFKWFGYLMILFFLYGAAYEFYIPTGASSLGTKVETKMGELHKQREQLEILEKTPPVLDLSKEEEDMREKGDEYNPTPDVY